MFDFALRCPGAHVVGNTLQSFLVVCCQQLLGWCSVDTQHSGLGDGLSSSRCCSARRTRNIVLKLQQCHRCRHSSSINLICCGQGTCMLAETRHCWSGCGHHPFPDGRSARHSAAGVLQHPCLCGCPQWTLLHGLRVCPLFHSQRQTWQRRMRYCQVDTAGLSDDDFLSLIFMPHHANNSQPVVAAHILFVAHVCQLQRWFFEGCDASRG